jgi:uncharacterized membrane protein YjjP (DUF1212 family)
MADAARSESEKNAAESGLHEATALSSGASSSSRSHKKSADEIADYLVEVGTTLAAYGCPSYRLEDVVREIAAVEGYHAEPFALPTGFFLSVSEESGSPPLQRMSRVEEQGVDLGRLTAIDHVFNDVIDRKSTIEQARTRLRALAKTDKGYPKWLRWIAITACSSAAAVFFQGGIVEVVAATLTGIGIYSFGRLVSKLPSGRFLVEFFGGFLAACAAGLASRVRPNIAHEVVVLAGVIALIPGMKFTTGLAELAKKSLVAGAARLMDAMITFLSISFGIALAIGLEKFAAVPAPLPVAREGLGLGAHAIAMVASSLAFGVLFSVPRAYLWAALVSGATGYVATSLATRTLPSHVAAFIAALCVCTLANGLARKLNRPAQLFQLPGMTLLVPGSFGFLSLGDFLQGDVMGGAAKGFQMVLIAGAIVMGVLVSNLILPARKLL